MLINQKKEETLKFLIFSMGNLHLAMGIDSVIRIIPLPQIHRSGDKLLGIATYEGREVLVIDLYKRIYGKESQISKGFLVIFAGRQSWYGITIASLPNVQDVPLSLLQPVPPEYRDRDTLGIASHMMQVSIRKSEQLQTVFLLDGELLLKMAS
ncbi:chemotaxis protein CheW [Pseudanabaena sp. FACHB-1998]|uniref:chemotaxis protein CheW n=1 Tax=Pseudanabaena sp. FACHB-1998 TaxID=2692858 RepID=UPI0016804EC3|nr:chemotaxis protein CheW [Pseudanabaena sp. FACHB-1998]MBD2177584.1 chemotaxis protein CheW [Pseudanabaena sp. FACHB-1998]